MPERVSTWPAAVMTEEDWEAYERDLEEWNAMLEEDAEAQRDEELQEMFRQYQHDLYHDEDFPF